MKKTIKTNKLTLNKMTIAALNTRAMRHIEGGIDVTTINATAKCKFDTTRTLQNCDALPPPIEHDDTLTD